MDALLIPFSILWGGFALFWNGTVWATNAPWFFRLWGLPFLLAGLYITVGRFVHDSWIRSRLRYAVTDRRVVIARPGRVRSLAVGRLPLFDVTDRANGSGDIRFGEGPSLFGGNGFQLWVPSTSSVPQFLAIPDVAHVRAVILDAERAAR